MLFIFDKAISSFYQGKFDQTAWAGLTRKKTALKASNNKLKIIKKE